MQLFVILIFSFSICYTNGNTQRRSKRAAYDLPDGVDLLIGSVSNTFQCQSDGYYADVANGCQIFHVCNTVTYPDGRSEILQYSFVCGNQTVFNQLTFTCAYEEEALPCESSPDFFYLNDRLGDPKALFLEDNDIERAEPLIARRGSSSSRSVPAFVPAVAPAVPPPAPPPPPAPAVRRPSRPRKPARKF